MMRTKIMRGATVLLLAGLVIPGVARAADEPMAVKLGAGSALWIDAAFPRRPKVFGIRLLLQREEEVRLSEVHAVLAIVGSEVRG